MFLIDEILQYAKDIGKEFTIDDCASALSAKYPEVKSMGDRVSMCLVQMRQEGSIAWKRGHSLDGRLTSIYWKE